jgi:hypothetical protein
MKAGDELFGTFYLATLVFTEETEDAIYEQAIPVLLLKDEDTGVFELVEILN